MIPLEKAQPEITVRVDQWAFEHDNEASRDQQDNLKQAAAFLDRNRSLFPPRSIPIYPVQLAYLALRICKVFATKKAKKLNDPAMVKAIAAELRKLNVHY